MFSSIRIPQCPVVQNDPIHLQQQTYQPPQLPLQAPANHRQAYYHLLRNRQNPFNKQFTDEFSRDSQQKRLRYNVTFEKSASILNQTQKKESNFFRKHRHMTLDASHFPSRRVAGDYSKEGASEEIMAPEPIQESHQPTEECSDSKLSSKHSDQKEAESLEGARRPSQTVVRLPTPSV